VTGCFIIDTLRIRTRRLTRPQLDGPARTNLAYHDVMKAPDSVASEQPTSIAGAPRKPIQPRAQETEVASPSSLGLAITFAVLAVLLGAVGVLLSLTTGFLGLPLLAASVALFAVASRQIKKNKPASAP
jgi:hypothetical protein